MASRARPTVSRVASALRTMASSRAVGERAAEDGAMLIKLFSSILRKDPERFVLVTPVERVGIAVDDAPFLAVEMAVEGQGAARRIAFRTNVDDLVTVDA